MIHLYQLMTSLCFVLALPFLPLIRRMSPRRRANLWHRCGFGPGIPPHVSGPARQLWIHALSVGEVRSALPLVHALRKDWPGWEVVFTASTVTGYQTVQDLFCRDTSRPLVSRTGYFPCDLPWAVSRIRRQIQPDLVCLVETDLWPGFLHAMARHGIPVVLVNARLSVQSFRGYQRMGRLARLFFSHLTRILCQTSGDADRFRQLDVPESRITIAGNFKWDCPVPDGNVETAASLGRRLGLAHPSDQVWVAGSTHPGEEAMILAAFRQVRGVHPGLRLILAPRDPGRAPGLVALLIREGFRPVLWSGMGNTPCDSPVILVDCLGVLSHLYGVGSVAFVGGSLVPAGGHNILEPAGWGRPVLFGPYMADFSDIAARMLSCRAGIQVTDTGNLADHLTALLSDPEHARAMGKRGREMIRQNTGAVAGTLKSLREIADAEMA